VIGKQVHETLESEASIRAQVREFYDSVGWKQIGDGLYQNARYEDLRPVSREYIHRCHLRVLRHLSKTGHLILDAGSGPVQYPEYLEYSSGFAKRTCLDISHRALAEARNRLGEHGLYVVGDISNLPFRSESFEGLVSLHTVHHLPPQDQMRAFEEFLRVMAEGAQAVVIYSWGDQSALVKLMKIPVALAFTCLKVLRRFRHRSREENVIAGVEPTPEAQALLKKGGTYTYKFRASALRKELSHLPGFSIRVWRSLSTSMLRAFIHRVLFGRQILRIVFWLEERAPGFFGHYGQYPMLLFNKASAYRQDRGESS
jgi:ubiquinone/menaquinone biosynthesis C-methylase UbiE